MYHYAGNNPVRYTDPDGKLIYSNIDDELAKVINYMYKKSPTFKNLYDGLLADNNIKGQPLFVLIENTSGKYLGNTQSQDSSILKDVLVFCMNKSNDISIKLLPEDTVVQAIIISIDKNKIEETNRDIFKVVAEEFSHAYQASLMGSDIWNLRAKHENNKPHDIRSEEIRASRVRDKIMEELSN